MTANRFPRRDRDEVVIVTNADCDSGHRCALHELARGRRVVVTARHASDLVRILPGHSASRVFAVAADFEDPRQRDRLVDRVIARFGDVDEIIDGRTGSPYRPMAQAS
jgi:NAD(P)-dependent dehydrogenase (short-subunit alcohol dehydrogenase family)